jgi:succinate dehydrogenase / fumarate reductase cytochrome b subunit
MIKTLILVKGSSVIKKIILASSGMLLIAFTIGHLLGNLLIFKPDRNLLNLYAHQVESLGILYRLAEIMILIAFLVHIGYATVISWENRQARGDDYYQVKSVGSRSPQSIFSRSMIYTGPLLLLFLLFHLKTFRFGLGIDDGYITEINGIMVRDLQRLVIEKFHQPIYTIGYTLAMITLGFHLRHGVKSACQSLGLNFSGFASTTIALLLSLGFIAVPVFIFWKL